MSVLLQDDQELPEELKCTYCKLILNEPVETSETDLRFCGECYDKAVKDCYRVNDLDPNDMPYKCSPQVKEQIDNLKVKCENFQVGCDWKGLFKQLMQHSQECQYVTVECRNPGCGQKVPKNKIEDHLKHECHRRFIKCEYCDKEMYFDELQAHTRVCFKTPRICRNCKKEIPASQLIHHMYKICKQVECVCKDENKIYEVRSQSLHNHLQDVNKLADHLGPMICEFTKMSVALEEMTVRYYLLTNRVEIIEKTNASLEKEVEQLKKSIEQRIEIKIKPADSKESLDTPRSSPYVSIKSASSCEIGVECPEQTVLQRPCNSIHCEKHSSMTNIKAIEERFAELDRNIKSLQEQLNSCNAKVYVDRLCEYEQAFITYKKYFSELLLFTVSTDGEYLWRITEVNEHISIARNSLNQYIESPPFYTGRNGYKMCIRAYLNGDGSGKGTHLSIFFVLIKGEYDPLLQWPFEPKVSLILVNQDHKKNVVQTFKPDGFQKPKIDTNVASGCPHFADLSILENQSYVKDDVMYIKAIVDGYNCSLN